MKAFARFILTKILGWKMDQLPTEIKKYVIIAAPHSSWVDFPIAMLYRVATGVMVHYVGKDSLFKGHFGFLFRKLGGFPVDRSSNNNTVDFIVHKFNSTDNFKLGLSPEGTRKKVDKWRTGFYYIAKGAKVPIVMATLDFGNKYIKISEPFYPTDNKDKDFEYMRGFFKNVKGKKVK
jgi:1-acyl-sn-glycerol-3-phosphate acyltransferase